MLALKFVAGLRVVEGFNIPFSQGEIFTVVLGMATRALQTCTRFNVVGSVKAFSRNDAPRNFSVAGETLEGGFSG